MLQGNPFETELVVDERTHVVRQGVKEQQWLHALEDHGKLLRQWQEVMYSLDLASLSAGFLQAVRKAWWLPTGIAGGIVLITLLGG